MVTQKEKIYDILKDYEWHSNVELHESTGIYRYGAIIHNLRKDGFNIEGSNSIEGRKVKKGIFYHRMSPHQGVMI